MSYVDLSLPDAPPHFSHANPPPFFDFDNSKYGNCVWAGAANETTLWMHEGGKVVRFETEDVLADYAAVTGFDASKPTTDQGTDVSTAARYRRRTGILDARGKRQRIDAYTKLGLGNIDLMRSAMWLLGGVGLGFKFPNYAMPQFQNGEPWDVQRLTFKRLKGWLMGDDIAGGHYVPAIGISPNGNILCISWGKIQEMTPKFFLKYADEIACYLDLDRLDRSKLKSPEGFNEGQLRRDLAALSGGILREGPRDDSEWC